jgi:hypothetical protein
VSQDLQQARYDQLVRRVGALYGGGSKVTEVLAELFPVLEVENTTPELLALTGWRTAWQVTQRLATAGNESTSQLFNPAGSGHLVAVTQLIMRTSVAGEVDFELDNTALAAGVAGLYRDGRYGVPRSTVAIASSLDGGATGGGPRLFIGTSDTVLRDDNGIVVLSPGTGLNIGTVGTQLRLTVNYFWRERPASPSELLFP